MDYPFADYSFGLQDGPLAIFRARFVDCPDCHISEIPAKDRTVNDFLKIRGLCRAHDYEGFTILQSDIIGEYITKRDELLELERYETNKSGLTDGERKAKLAEAKLRVTECKQRTVEKSKEMWAPFNERWGDKVDQATLALVAMGVIKGNLSQPTPSKVVDDNSVSQRISQ